MQYSMKYSTSVTCVVALFVQNQAQEVKRQQNILEVLEINKI